MTFPRALVLGVVSAVACGAGGSAPLPAGVVGASIAVIDDGATVAVVNPDQGSVSFVDADTLARRGTVDVGGEPHTLLALPGGDLLVANDRGGEIVRVRPSTMAVVARRAVCAGPYGLAATPDGAQVDVSCEWDGTVRAVDPDTLASTLLGGGLRRPRALAVVGAEVVVADYVGGLVHVLAASGAATTTTSLVPSSAPYRPALSAMSANLTAAIVPAFGGLAVAHVLENNTGDATEPVAADYGTVQDTNPKINPAVTLLGAAADDLGASGAAAPPVLYAAYDGGTRVYSGPSALAAFGDRYVLVAHVSTANVAVVDLGAASPSERAVATFDVGFGPSGIAVDPSRGVAYVDNALDGSISRVDLTRPFAVGAPEYAADATRVLGLAPKLTPDAASGRELFFDATNPHVTPSGVVACASCHPAGSDDGLVWFEHTQEIPLRHRRTPHLGNAKTPTAPFHWDGEFPEMSALVESTIVGLMGGDGLLVDTSTVQAFIDEAVAAPLVPAVDPASAARGKAIFDSLDVGCSSCHVGDYLTDDAMHTVLDPMSLDPADTIAAANTPGLHGVSLAAPYFHDGRSPSLEDLLTREDAEAMGHHQDLSPSQRADLIAFLGTL